VSRRTSRRELTRLSSTTKTCSDRDPEGRARTVRARGDADDAGVEESARDTMAGLAFVHGRFESRGDVVGVTESEEEAQSTNKCGKDGAWTGTAHDSNAARGASASRSTESEPRAGEVHTHSMTVSVDATAVVDARGTAERFLPGRDDDVADATTEKEEANPFAGVRSALAGAESVAPISIDRVPVIGVRSLDAGGCVTISNSKHDPAPSRLDTNIVPPGFMSSASRFE
jgi:hypothetical protein